MIHREEGRQLPSLPIKAGPATNTQVTRNAYPPHEHLDSPRQEIHVRHLVATKAAMSKATESCSARCRAEQGLYTTTRSGCCCTVTRGTATSINSTTSCVAGPRCDAPGQTTGPPRYSAPASTIDPPGLSWLPQRKRRQPGGTPDKQDGLPRSPCAACEAFIACITSHCAGDASSPSRHHMRWQELLSSIRSIGNFLHHGSRYLGAQYSRSLARAWTSPRVVQRTNVTMPWDESALPETVFFFERDET